MSPLLTEHDPHRCRCTFDQVTDVAGVYVKTDNVVYSVDDIYVEYYDAISEAWVTADAMTDVPAASEVTTSLLGGC